MRSIFHEYKYKALGIGSTHLSLAVSECDPCSAPCSPTGWCCILTSPQQTYGTAWSAGDTQKQQNISLNQ